MIVLVLGNVAASRKMLSHVRDCVATLEAPAAYIDAIDGIRFDPVSAMKLETAESVMSRLEKMAAMLWEGGARRLVIPVPVSPPGQPVVDLPRLAFWLKRAWKQPVYKLDVDQYLREKSIGTWSPAVLELTLRQMAKSLGPRQEVMPWLPTPPRYETDRLSLTWPTEAQVESYYREIVGTEVFKNLIWNGPNNVEELHDYWWERRQVFARGRDHDLSLAAIERASGEMIGGCSIRPKSLRNNEHDVWDMGYLIAQRWHGRGYGTEMVAKLVDIAFRERGAHRLYADAFVGNQASRRVLEKNGFVLEGMCRSVIAKPDGRRDEWKLAMTREDWEKRAAQ